MAKTKEQLAYEADLALIAQAEADAKAIEEQERKLEEARQRVAEYERIEAITAEAKERAERFLDDVAAITWTDEDQQIIERFPAAIVKQNALDSLMFTASARDYWKNVPREYVAKMRAAAKDTSSAGPISPASVLAKAIETLEAN